MRSIFPGHFRPTADQFKVMWTTCAFAVDANVVLNLYRYSTDTRRELERTLTQIKDRIFLPHRAAEEFLRNRLQVTASQAKEYTKAIDDIGDLRARLSDKKRHPFIANADLPKFAEMAAKLVTDLQAQQASLLNRLANDEVLEFVESTFANSTGMPLSAEELAGLIAEGEDRYKNEVPPGYRDGKKDNSGDPNRKFGDLIVWKQIILHAKTAARPIVFVTDDVKDDWWLEQSGKTIGPRPELRAEFLREANQEFWMYTVDKFIEEVARDSKTKVNKSALAEIIEVSKEASAERTARASYATQYRPISKDEMLDRLARSEEWSRRNSEGFLGLHAYVRHYLGNAGYDRQVAYEVIRQLEEEGILEVYDHRGAGHDTTIQAIRIVRPDGYANRPLQALGTLLKSGSSTGSAPDERG